MSHQPTTSNASETGTIPQQSGDQAPTIHQATNTNSQQASLDFDMQDPTMSSINRSPIQHARDAVDRATQNLIHWAIQLSRTDLPVEQLQIALARHDLADRSLASLQASLQKLTAESQSATTVPTPHTTNRLVVPSDLPLLQWAGNVSDRTKPVFASVQECLDRFEDIVESYAQDLDSAWCRLLPRMLSPDQRSWFVDHLKPHASLPWSFARKTIVNKYGIQDAERQAQHMQELVNMRMQRNESVESYTDRFHKVRREAGCEDSRIIATIFTNSLLPELQQHVSLGQAHLSADQRASTDQAANLARNLYGKVVLSQHSKQAAAHDSTANTKGKAVKRSVPSERGKKFCQTHGHCYHSTEECRKPDASLKVRTSGAKVSKHAASSSSGSGSSSRAGSSSATGNLCFRCKAPWSPDHACKVNHMAIRSATLLLEDNATTTPVTPPPAPATSLPSVSGNTPSNTASLASGPPPSPHATNVASSSPSAASEDIVMSDVEPALRDASSQ